MLYTQKKKILIDATTVSAKTDGLSIYILNLIANIPHKSFSDFEYWLLITPKKIESIEKIKLSGRFRYIEYNVPMIGPLRDIAMSSFFRKHRNFFDLVHITSNNYPLGLTNGICTVHDLTYLKYLNGSGIYTKFAQYYMKFSLKYLTKYAKLIIAVSNSTKKEICKVSYNLRDKNKIRVIYEGWEHISYPHTAYDDTINKYSSYLLYLGTSRHHKNIARLLVAFELALDKIPSHIKLLISGNNNHVDSDILKIVHKINEVEKRVIFTGYLSDEHLGNLYRNADAFIFPSLSEGFGLPILEAFYHQCPLLCSNTTSMPEVAGDAAIYFNPYDCEDICNAIVEFYNNPFLANIMKVKGRDRLEKFSWKRTSSETVNLYYEYFNDFYN